MEDNPADVWLVREALQEYQVRCEVTVIVNGERAIKFIEEVDAGEQCRPDLIILDLNLPKKPGIAVLQHVRASGCHDVPVIVLTSSDSQKDKDGVARYSPSRYIRKPSRLDEFVKLGAVFRHILLPTS